MFSYSSTAPNCCYLLQLPELGHRQVPRDAGRRHGRHQRARERRAAPGNGDGVARLLLCKKSPNLSQKVLNMLTYWATLVT